jgi:cell division protease FtsH
LATAEVPIDSRTTPDGSRELARQWRSLIRAATLVAVLTSPVAFVYFHDQLDIGVGWSLLWTFLAVIAFRGLIDIGFRRFIPWPSLFGSDGDAVRQEDVVNRRRAWYWRKKYRLAAVLLAVVTIVYVFRALADGFGEASWLGTAEDMLTGLFGLLSSPALWAYAVLFPMLFLFNFLILFGPLMLMAVTQIRGYEPGDADWGVKLDDVRGQAEAKEEVRRIVNLWQSGEAFERAGGKRERGLLFLGAPGTGKTMLSKAIATGFNSPFVSIPGSGFAQTFIGMDALTVRWLAWKAKRLARKWGGQCIVFIDEIDAVGMRRSTLGAPTAGMTPAPFEDFCFYGPWGAQTPTGDLILETRAWRERLFEQRAPRPAPATGLVQKVGGLVNQAMPGMFGTGQLALNQLLIVMDGIGNPPFFKRLFTNRFNTFLDATYVIPRRIGRLRLRMKPPRPAPEQIYFIGACNVPIESLDPALTRPGRMGRHVWFRTPTKQDRADIFELYLGKVAHDTELDTPRKRDEIARITMGYSPAMIEQVCSMALTYAHHDGRPAFSWDDLVESMTTVESGTAINIEYVPDETRAVAIHEAGHAAAAHVFMPGVESTRVSIRRRGGSLGHHQALEKEERFSRWRHEQMGTLIWTLGAMAAEQVFYGENSDGVGGDVQSATTRAAFMVGTSAMGPEWVDVDRVPDDETEQQARERLMERFEAIGLQIMNRTGGGTPFTHDPISSVLNDPHKRRTAARILGQAYLKAHHLMDQNREAVDKLANDLIVRREIYGDELLELLRDANLQPPVIDYQDERAWPRI